MHAHLIWSEKLRFHSRENLEEFSNHFQVWNLSLSIPCLFLFFVCFQFESLYVINFLLVPWATSYSSALAEALAITLVASS